MGLSRISVALQIQNIKTHSEIGVFITRHLQSISVISIVEIMESKRQDYFYSLMWELIL